MERLKSLREAKGFSQDELAKKTGLSQSYICKLENKSGANPTYSTLKKIADELEVSVADLIKKEDVA